MSLRDVRESMTISILMCVISVTVTLLTMACQPQGKPEPATRPSSLADRSQKALKDPFGYSPEFEKSDVSGGGMMEFDQDGFNRDMDNVLNP